LTVTAFGPFAGTVDVDLDQLSAAGIFLLHGETGAGKTTLLDALGFALYGRVPGERGKAKRLRSDHAPPDVRTSVVLELTLTGRRLRITRAPQQDKPSARGGQTTVPAKVQLDEQIGDTWRNVSTRVGEADAEIAELMGMSAEQFFQVVLLPQGEFARFLRADSAERGQLLQRLFGTDRYRAVEDWLAEQRRLTAALVDDAEQQARLLVARLVQVADADERADTSLQWVEEVAGQVRDRAEQATAAVERCRDELDRARAAASEQEQLAARQVRRLSCVTRQAALDAGAPAIDLLGVELSAAVRAAVVAPRSADLTQRAAVLDSARLAEEGALAAVPVGAVLGDLLDAERSRCVRLRGLQSVATSLAAEEHQVADAAEEAQQAARRRGECVRALAELPGQVQLAEQGLAQVRSAEQALPAVEARALVLRSQVRDATALSAALAECALQRDVLTLARESAVALKEKALEIREARFDSMVAELATNLADGDPCPVCGGLEHPDPSLLLGARVTRDDEDRAQAEYDAARRAVEDAGAALAAAEATAADLRSRLGTAAGRPLDDLAGETDQLVIEAQGLQALVASGADRQAAWEGLQTARRDLELERTAATAEQQSCERRRSEAEQRAAVLRRTLADELGVDLDLASALERAADTVIAVERALSCAEAVTRAQAEVTLAQRSADQAARDAGFATLELAVSAERPAPWRLAAEERLRAAESERAAVAALLADPDLDVALDPAADVIGAAAALADATAVADVATSAAATAAAAAQACATLAPQLEEVLVALRPLIERAEEVRRLADLVAGTSAANTLRMSLPSFVLAARLEEVALAASERLLRMSQGRFSLVHTDSGRGGGRSGLGLLARDTWTGQDRETSTLSGGETFLASLALALGLADVVAAESGGARIEALFVDEGFGTLDEDTLDEVMDVLDGLREGGRVVGLVSHVAELRQRIPAQVQVRKGRAGSDLTVLGC